MQVVTAVKVYSYLSLAIYPTASFESAWLEFLIQLQRTRYFSQAEMFDPDFSVLI